MNALKSTGKRILAALTFFTRLPFWRLGNVEREHYERVVPLWPLAGWLTGGIMALVCWGAMSIGMPVSVSVMLALISRVLATGALHEDGFADFCDGFGGGTSRERTLAIMKDSHIGTYGVLGLVLYYLLLTAVLSNLLAYCLSPLIMVAVDPFCKWISSTIIFALPYARPEAEAKNRLIYARTPGAERVVSFLLGILPAAVFVFTHYDSIHSGFILPFFLCLPPAAVLLLLCLAMQRRIGGYTGDCCGAAFILTELASYMGLLILFCL